MEHQDNLIGVLKTLYKWRKQLIYLVLAAGIGTAIISLFLPNYYKSTGTFLAASPDRISSEAYFPRGAIRTYYYGNDDDIDRIMTVAESSELINFLVDSFNLYEHYSINPDLPKSPDRVQKRFRKLYELKKTKRDAIELSVEDKDPEFAAKVARAALNKVDETTLELVRQSQRQELETLEDNIATKSSELIYLSDTLEALRKIYGIYNIMAQTELLPAQLAGTESKYIRENARLTALKETPGIPKDTIKMIQAKVRGIEEELKAIQLEMDTFNRGLPIIGVHEKMYLEANQKLTEDREHLKRVRATYKAKASAVIRIEDPQVPIVKSRPRRSIIVITAFAIALIFGVIGIFLLEFYRDVNWKEVLDAE
ncbi:MAG: hypothetical protein AAF798_10660 [Bacteroidota bacterium]